MNGGRYPDSCVNEAVERINQGADPRDVADELREEYGYETLHWKTLKRWQKKYPMGKQPKSLPPGLKEEVQELVREYTSQERLGDSGRKEVWERLQKRCAAGEHDYKLEHYTTAAPLLAWRRVCQFCEQEEVLNILTGTYYLP